MNVTRLFEVLNELTSGEEIYPIASQLDELVRNLNNLTSNPSDASQQQAFANSLERLFAHLADRLVDFEPDILATTEEIGVQDFFTPTIAEKIRSSLEKNPATPAVTLELAREIQTSRKSTVAALAEARDGLAVLGFEPEELEIGKAEIGFQIPREIFDNQFDEFIKELNTTKFVIESASLLTKGEIVQVDLGDISSSDPTVILGLDPKVVAMIGGFVTWSLHTWKQAEEIRQIRKKTAQIPELEDVTGTLDQKIEEIVKAKLEEKALELATEYKKKSDKELVNRLSRSLRMVLERVERGLKVHLRLPPAQPDDEVEEEAINVELRQVQSELEFPKAAAEPILKLTKDEEKDE